MLFPLLARKKANSTSHSLTHSLTNSVTHSLNQLTHSVTHSLTHPITHSLTHSPTHSLTQCPSNLFIFVVTFLLSGIRIEHFDHVAFTVRRPTVDPGLWAEGKRQPQLDRYNLLAKYPTEMQDAERTCWSEDPWGDPWDPWDRLQSFADGLGISPEAEEQ